MNQTQTFQSPTLAQTSTAISSGLVSPVDVVNRHLDAIAANDGRLSSFVALRREEALNEAKQAEAAITAGRRIGPLHGIPVAVKDIFDVEGMETTGQSATLIGNMASEDAVSVSLLKKAGAIVIGKTTTWEMAIGGLSLDIPWPPVRNPWGKDRDPSGSSNGSAVAVAAGFCLAALGSDTGGSIRTPAAWCGVAGLKPTFGLVSKRGVLPLAYSQDHVGPLAWTSEDCALIMDAISGFDSFDVSSANVQISPMSESIGKSLKGLRVGVVRHFFENEQPAGEETIKATELSLDALRELGAVVKDVTLSPLKDYNAIGTLTSRAEGYAVHKKAIQASPEKFGTSARRWIMSGAFISAGDYVNILRHRARLIAEMRQVMATCDVILLPTAGQPAGLLGEEGKGTPSQSFYTRPFNVTGNPALSVCSGFSQTGLPLSLQIAGRPFEDAMVLQVGDAIEKAMGTRTRRLVF